MTTDLARRDERLGLSAEQIDLVKRTIAKDHSNDELALFINQCNRTGLDPFARQIYSIKRGGTAQVQVSIDGARLVAERTGRYRPGHTYYYDADGNETSVWLSDDAPSAARVTVFKDDHEVPGIPVRWKERVQGTSAWKTMPATMLAKCAEMATLRQAFPQDLSGLYSPEEIALDPEFSYGAGPKRSAIEAASTSSTEQFVAPAGADKPKGKLATKAQIADLAALLMAHPDEVGRLASYLGQRDTYGTEDLKELTGEHATKLIEELKAA